MSERTCNTCRYWKSFFRLMGRCRLEASANHGKLTSRGVGCYWHTPRIARRVLRDFRDQPVKEIGARS